MTDSFDHGLDQIICILGRGIVAWSAVFPASGQPDLSLWPDSTVGICDYPRIIGISFMRRLGEVGRAEYFSAWSKVSELYASVESDRRRYIRCQPSNQIWSMITGYLKYLRASHTSGMLFLVTITVQTQRKKK